MNCFLLYESGHKGTLQLLDNIPREPAHLEWQPGPIQLRVKHLRQSCNEFSISYRNMVAFTSSCYLVLVLLALGPLSAVQAGLRLFNIRANGLPSGLFGTTDGYVEVSCGSAYLGKTSIRKNNPNPWWEEEFTYFKALPNDVLRLTCYDSDVLLDDLLGTCQRPIKVGTHSHDCYLKKGTLSYTYTLDGVAVQAAV